MKKGERESIAIRRNCSIRTLEREKIRFKKWERNIRTFYIRKDGPLPEHYYDYSIAYIMTEYLNYDSNNHYTIEEKLEISRLSKDMYQYFNE